MMKITHVKHVLYCIRFETVEAGFGKPYNVGRLRRGAGSRRTATYCLYRLRYNSVYLLLSLWAVVTIT
jgi:hypothetical protein